MNRPSGSGASIKQRVKWLQQGPMGIHCDAYLDPSNRSQTHSQYLMYYLMLPLMLPLPLPLSLFIPLKLWTHRASSGRPSRDADTTPDADLLLPGCRPSPMQTPYPLDADPSWSCDQWCMLGPILERHSVFQWECIPVGLCSLALGVFIP